MKTYQTPEILWQEFDLVDILTTSFVDGQGADNTNSFDWWVDA